MDMKTLPLATRQKIIDRYEEHTHTRQAIADEFGVSLGMVKKLIQQFWHSDDIGPLPWDGGRYPKLHQGHKDRLLELILENPLMTLKEYRAALRLRCSLTIVHAALKSMGMTYDVRRSGHAVKVVPGPPWNPRRVVPVGIDGPEPKEVLERLAG